LVNEKSQKYENGFEVYSTRFLFGKKIIATSFCKDIIKRSSNGALMAEESVAQAEQKKALPGDSELVPIYEKALDLFFQIREEKVLDTQKVEQAKALVEQVDGLLGENKESFLKLVERDRSAFALALRVKEEVLRQTLDVVWELQDLIEKKRKRTN
jgi:hypothetical protein